MKQIYLILFCLSFGANAFAQDRMDRNEKLKTLKVAYITEKLNLSQAEAEKFWPIYNEYEEKTHELRKESYEDKKLIDSESLTEEQATAIIKKFKNHNTKRSELYSKYISDLQNVLTSKKIVLLKKFEDDFKRKMFEEYKKRRHDKGDKP